MGFGIILYNETTTEDLTYFITLHYQGLLTSIPE